jgi:hypothetical protein
MGKMKKLLIINIIAITFIIIFYVMVEVLSK